MGLAELFLGKENPFSQYVSDNKNTVHGAFAGLSQGNSFASGLGGAAMGANRGAVMDDLAQQQKAEEEKRQEMINRYAQTLRGWGGEYEDLATGLEVGGLDPAQAYMTAWERRYAPKADGQNLMSVGGHLYDKTTGQWISPPETAENRQNISLTPQWGQDAQGNPVMLQPSSTGELVQAQPPEGVTLLGPYGTSADRAAGSAFGKGTGSAQFDLPAAALTTQQTLNAIQSVRDQAAGMDEQFGNIMGVPQQLLPTLPQSERANFQVETNRLINRTFLEAREVLRGGGQITDFESRKAEGAISNLEEAMMRGDKALFQKSLDELEEAVRDGYAKLQVQAQSMPGYGGGQQAPSAGQNYVYNPATGQLEPQ